jgi:hypothetical protein
MPKVSRADTAGPLQPAAMVVDDAAPLPAKPNFSALTAAEQQKGKVEFRRVRQQQLQLRCTPPSALTAPAPG